MAARKIGTVCPTLVVLLGTAVIGSKLDNCTTVLCDDRQQELSMLPAPAAEHTVGLALPLPAIVGLFRYSLPLRIESFALNACGYETPLSRLRSPPLSRFQAIEPENPPVLRLGKP